MGVRPIAVDTGALKAVEKKAQRMADRWETAVSNNIPLVTTALVIAEWWHDTQFTRLMAKTLRIAAVDEAFAKQLKNARVYVESAVKAARREKPISMTDVALVVLAGSANAKVIYTGDVEDVQFAVIALYPLLNIVVEHH